MRLETLASTALLAVWLWPADAAAVTLGQSDTFESGVTEGWVSGGSSPNPPVGVAGGGPGGVDDGYLLVRANGSSGAGGKLTVHAGGEWAGDYAAAGVTALSMDLKNLGSTALSLRVYLAGSSGAAALSSQAVSLAVGSEWQRVQFSVVPAELTGNAASVLAGVTQLRLFHATASAFPGENIAALLGVDNVTAVPEPATALSLALGLAALAGVCPRRRRLGDAPRAIGPHPLLQDRLRSAGA